ncbi:MAG: MoaD/ThiS family protein [Candidatus Thorarchaeota archaeon]|jgi:molybdopterin converting factor small subunit
MKIEIRFRGPLASKPGMQAFHLDIEDGANLGMTLQKLIESEDGVKSTWSNTQRMDREALILRNETDIGLTGGLDTLLEDGDKIVILPLVHGG